jgi:hypothetical protein
LANENPFDLKPKYVVERIEKDDKHFYTIDGTATYWPGSTTVLNVLGKPWLMNWVAKVMGIKMMDLLLERSKVSENGQVKICIEFETKKELEELIKVAKRAHREIKEAAGDLGTRAHDAIDSLTKNGVADITDDIKVPVEGFLSWQTATDLRIVHGDTKLIYREDGMCFGGSLDGLSSRGDRLIVIDYKTSNQLSESYAMQIASYCYAFAFTFNLDYIPEGYCVRFGKEKAETEVAKVASIAKSFDGFRHCYYLHQLFLEPQFLPSEFKTYSKVLKA